MHLTKPTEQLIDEGLEKRFDDTFPFGVCHVSNMTRMPDAAVKDFIRKEIAAEKEKWHEEELDRAVKIRELALAEAYERGEKESDDKWQGLIKTAAENSKKELAEAIKRTREEDLGAINKELEVLRNWHKDLVGAPKKEISGLIIEVARIRDKVSSLRDNPIKER